MNYKLPYNLSLYELYSDKWVKYYCLNRLFRLGILGKACKNLLVDGGVGGDVEWGIHKWNSYTQEDFGVGRFEGYRYYLGEDEHGESYSDDIDAYFSEEDLKLELAYMIAFQIKHRPDLREPLLKVSQELEIPTEDDQ